MKIPTKFTIGGLTWTVRRVKRLKGCYGSCHIPTQTIKILDTLAPEIKEQTFCHELVHAILYGKGLLTENHDEELVDSFAMFLHQYMNTAIYDDNT
jgi:hypothetical protein